MQILWICEKIKQWDQSLVALLCGKHPVFLFDKIENLTLELRNKQGQSLKGHLLIDLDSLGLALQELKNLTPKLNASGVTLILSRNFPFYDHSTIPTVLNAPEILLNPEDKNVDLVTLVRKSSNSQSSQMGLVRYKNIEFSFEDMSLRFLPDGQPENLPLKEARLLRVMLQNPSKVWTRDELQQAIWDRLKVSPRTIDSHISILRKKLQYSGISIESKYGGGYTIT